MRCVGRTGQLVLFPERNHAPRHLPASRLRSRLGVGRAGPRIAQPCWPPSHSRPPASARTRGPVSLGQGTGTPSTGPASIATPYESRRVVRPADHPGAVRSQRCFTRGVGCHGIAVHFGQSSAPRGRRGWWRGWGTEREGHAVQPADQPDALRRVTPLACASVAPRLARGLSATLYGRPERAGLTACNAPSTNRLQGGFVLTGALLERIRPANAAVGQSSKACFRQRRARQSRSANPQGPPSPGRPASQLLRRRGSSPGAVPAVLAKHPGAVGSQRPTEWLPWLPRNGRTLAQVSNSRAVTEGGHVARTRT